MYGFNNTTISDFIDPLTRSFNNISISDFIDPLTKNNVFWFILAIATLVGGIAAIGYFLEKWQQLKSKNKLKNYNEKLEMAQAAFHSKERMFFLTEFLKWKYNDKILLNKLEYTYPIAIFPAPKEQRKDLESVLYQPLSKNSTKDFIVDDDSYKKLIQELGILGESGKPLINRETFTMNYLSINAKLEMKCQLGTYFDALNSCDALEWEILQNISNMKKLEISTNNFNLFSNKLKLRKKLHEKVSDPVINGKGRSAAVAISTLIAYNDGEKFKLLIKMRSQTGVAVHAGLFHVVPSFMFQSIVGERDFEFSVVHNIFREYLEEIFDIPEEDNTEAADYFYENANLKILRKLIENNEAELFFTGVAVNLLNLRPEICTLLLINSPEWYKLQSQDMATKIGKLKKFSYNKEFAGFTKVKDKSDFIYQFEYIEDENELLNSYSLYPNKMVPPGAAAFWLGYDLIKETLNMSQTDGKMSVTTKNNPKERL